MKCVHCNFNEAEPVSVKVPFFERHYWCPKCGALGGMYEEEGTEQFAWKIPLNESGICPCGGYQVRSYDEALDSYRLVCEECGR